MKKILSFTLVLAMILGSVSFCFATSSQVEKPAFAATTEAGFVDVAATDKCYEAVNVLKAIGCIEGTSAGRFQPEATLTRAQIVAFVVKALGYPVTEGNSYVTKFADVPATEWYAGYVYWGSNLGIVDGRTATKFDPNAKVTADEAIAFILRVLGYNDNITGGYPAGYLLRANQEGFFKIISAGTATVTRGETARMLYKIAGVSNGYVGEDASNKGKFITYTTAAAGLSTIYDKYDCSVDAAKVITDDDIYAATTLVDLRALKGANVSLVEKDGKVVGIGEITTQFVSGVTQNTAKTKWYIGGIEVVDSPTKNGPLFTNGKGTANQTLNYNSTTNYPGVFAVEVATTGTNAGKITAIKSYQEWTATKTFVFDDDYIAAEYDATGKKYIGTGPMLESYKLPVVEGTATINTEYVTFEGVDSVEDIKDGDLVTVYMYNNEYVSKVVVSTDTVTGICTEKSSDGKTVVIGGTKYTLATGNNLISGASIVPSKKEATYYLNADGKIAGVKAAATTTAGDTTYYGIVLAAYAGKDATTQATLGTAATAKELPGLKIFTEEGKEAALYVSSAAITSKPAFNAGDLISYKLNKKGEVYDETKIAAANTGKVSAKGMLNTSDGLFNSDSVIFKYVGTAAADATTMAKAANWAVIPYTDLLEETLVTGSLVVKNAGTGKVTAAYVKLASTPETAEDYYIFKDYVQVADGYKYTALNLTTGEEETFVAATSTEFTPFSATARKVYTVTLTAGVATKATEVNLVGTFATGTDELNWFRNAKYDSLEVVNGIVFKTEYDDLNDTTATTSILTALDDDAVVYSVDGKTIKAMTVAGLNDVKPTSGVKYNIYTKDVTSPADGEVEYVFVVKGVQE